MPDVVLKYNLSCGNRVDYFSGLWASHRNRQRLEMMTDVTLIGMEDNGNGYKSVKVHQPIIMPVSTVLADTARYLLKEDPVFMFPDDHIDIIQAYVNFLYEGYFLITETVTEDKVLNFMNRTGLILPPGSFQVLPISIPTDQNIVQSQIIVNNSVMTEAVQSPLLPDITTAPVSVENCDANDAVINEETDQKGIITRSGSVNGKKKLKVKQISPCNAECLDITDKKSVDRRSTRSKSKSRMFEDFTATDNEGLDITETRSVGRRSTRSKLRPRMFDDFDDYDNEAKVSAKQRRTVNENFESLKKAATADSHVQVKNKRIVRKSFYPCIICNHPCKTVKELTDHCDKLHKGALFKCPVCSLEYLTFKKLRNHQYYQKHFPLNVNNEGDSPMTNRAENIPFSHNQLKTPVEDPVVSSASVNNNVLPAKRKLTFDDSIVGTAEDDVEEGEGAPETGVTISIPGPPGPELSPCDTNDKPLMILICPIVSCTTKVPIYDITTNESLQAQEYIHNHQKIAHNFTEKQFCSQVVFDHDQEDDKKGITTPDKRPGDNLSLVLSSDSEESDAVEVPENLAQSQQSGGYEEMETSQIWNQKLMKTWKQLRSRYFDILGEIFIIVTSTATSSENGKEHYDYSFKIGNLSASGSGDSRMLAKEDAAYNMYVKLVNQVDHNDAESVRSVICG